MNRFILLLKNKTRLVRSRYAQAQTSCLSSEPRALPPTTVIPNYGRHDTLARLHLNIERLLQSNPHFHISFLISECVFLVNNQLNTSSNYKHFNRFKEIVNYKYINNFIAYFRNRFKKHNCFKLCGILEI